MARNRERDALKGVNPSSRWISRVDKMNDEQVWSIYKRLRLQGKL